jgi:hypothetical protein
LLNYLCRNRLAFKLVAAVYNRYKIARYRHE